MAPRTRKPPKPTHRAVLATGETVDYAGAHPTHWSFGGVDDSGNPDGSPVRTVPVVSRHHLSVTQEAHEAATAAYWDGEDPEDDTDE